MPEDNIIKLNSTEDYNFQLFNVINGVSENDNNFKKFLSKKYFSLEEGAVVNNKKFLNFTEFRDRDSNLAFDDYTDDVKSYQTEKEDDIKTFFNSQKPGKYDAYLSKDKKDFNVLDFVGGEEKNVALNEFKQRQAELYVILKI